MRRYVRKRAIYGAIRGLLEGDVGLMWARTVGLPHSFLNLWPIEAFGFEKLDALR